MRRRDELVARERVLHDDLWYVRHVTEPLPKNTPSDIVEAAKRVAAKIATSRDPAYLDALVNDPFSLGKLYGELSTVRWALGDEDGLLDT